MAITGVGVCTWLFGSTPLEEIARRVSALGYDGVELLGELDGQRPDQVQDTLGSAGLRVLSMTPANVDLAHPSAYVRRQAIDYYYQLLEWAAALGAPLISCHGAVGRVRAFHSQAQERALFVQSVHAVGLRAQIIGLRVAVEHVNRYESHLLNACSDGLAFIEDVGLPNAGIHLDTYHMNIEEGDPPGAVAAAGHRLFLFHAADSNRRGLGGGHTDLPPILAALAASGYHGPIVMECTPPGPDPFRAIKDGSSVAVLERDLAESLAWLKARVSVNPSE